MDSQVGMAVPAKIMYRTAKLEAQIKVPKKKIKKKWSQFPEDGSQHDCMAFCPLLQNHRKCTIIYKWLWGLCQVPALLPSSRNSNPLLYHEKDRDWVDCIKATLLDEFCSTTYSFCTFYDWQIALFALSHETDKLSFNVKALVWSETKENRPQSELWFSVLQESVMWASPRWNRSRKFGESARCPMEEVQRDPGQMGNQVNKERLLLMNF